MSAKLFPHHVEKMEWYVRILGFVVNKMGLFLAVSTSASVAGSANDAVLS